MRVTKANICKKIKADLGLIVEMTDHRGVYTFKGKGVKPVNLQHSGKLTDKTVQEWVLAFEDAHENKPVVREAKPVGRVWPARLQKLAEGKGYTFENCSDFQSLRCVIKPPAGQVINSPVWDTLHRWEYTKKRDDISASNFWPAVLKTVSDLEEPTPCKDKNCDLCKPDLSPRPALSCLAPDANTYQDSADSIRELISRTGMDMRSVCDVLGVKYRTMQDWCSPKIKTNAPYTVQFSLECLVGLKNA